MKKLNLQKETIEVMEKTPMEVLFGGNDLNTLQMCSNGDEACTSGQTTEGQGCGTAAESHNGNCGGGGQETYEFYSCEYCPSGINC